MFADDEYRLRQLGRSVSSLVDNYTVAPSVAMVEAIHSAIQLLVEKLAEMDEKRQKKERRSATPG